MYIVTTSIYRTVNNTINIISQMFIIIVRWLNPFYIILTPFVYIARLCHQLPILINSRTPNNSCSTYNKYSMVPLPPDSNFIQDRWQSFQYVEWRFTDVWTSDKCRERCDAWSMTHFKCKSNFIENEGDSKEYVKTITRKKPSEVIINSTHLIIFFKNTIVIFMDHYFCDGLILADLIKEIFYEDNISSKTFPKYKNYPLISDYMAIEFSGRTLIENMKYPSLIKGLSDKTYVLTETFKKNEDLPWNRWAIYARGIYNIYEALPEDIEYLRIGVTVGFDTDITFGNNRIGIIIVTIKRLSAYLSQNEKILNYMEEFKNQALKKMNDANTSYDIVRSYNMNYIRTNKMKRVLYVYFTSFFFKEELTHNVSGVGGYVGTLNTAENIYISALSRGSTTFYTYVSNVKQLNINKLTSYGIALEYEFDNNDPNQF